MAMAVIVRFVYGGNFSFVTAVNACHLSKELAEKITRQVILPRYQNDPDSPVEIGEVLDADDWSEAVDRRLTRAIRVNCEAGRFDLEEYELFEIS